MSKKVQGNVSSFFDLKAELLKKKDILKEQSSQAGVDRAAIYVKGKPVLSEKRRAIREAKEAQKNAKSVTVVSDAEQQELQRQLAKSRQTLEAKAALYDRLRSGKAKDLDEGNQPIYLVNFSQNAHDEIDEVSSEDETDNDLGKKASRIPSTSASPSRDDDIVEYTDCLGRTRTCHKSELQSILSADKGLSVRSATANWSKDTELMSEDMRRELRRQEWEKEAEEAAELGPIHFQHVMSNEPRTLGTAYYHFSLDEATRQEQLKQLKEASEQTKVQRERNARLKERRKKLMDERLRKVMERKNISAPTLPESEGESDVTSIPLPLDKSEGQTEEKKEVEAVKKKRFVSPRPVDRESMKGSFPTNKLHTDTWRSSAVSAIQNSRLQHFITTTNCVPEMLDRLTSANGSSGKETGDFAHFLSRVTSVQHDFSSLARFYATCVQISSKVCVRQEGDKLLRFLRFYGMGIPPNNDRTCLLYYDFYLDCHDRGTAGYWRVLLDPAVVKPIGKLSLEEELLRERKRSFTSAFLTYDFSAIRNSFLYSQCGEVFEFQENPSTAINKTTSLLSGTGNPINLLYCPDKPQYFAMVAGSEVYVCNTGNSFCFAIRPTESGWTYGSPPFVIQEEFERYDGMWWCPENDERTLLLVEACNEDAVQKVAIGLGGCSTDGLERISYPYAGSTNALWNLKLYMLQEQGDTFSMLNCPFKYDFRTLFPWAEYLVKCGWYPDGTAIWLLLMDRLQRTVRLVYVPLHCFQIESSSAETGGKCGITIVYEETSNHWLPIHNSLVFLEPVYKHSVRFTWLSRRTGFSHLYLVDAVLSHQTEEAPNQTAWVKENVDIIQEVQLTAGEWDVLLSTKASGRGDRKENADKINMCLVIEVDENRCLIYFLAVADTPLESHIYVTSYAMPGMEPIRLTELGYSYGVPREKKCMAFNDDLSVMTTFRSNVTCPGECIVYCFSFPECANPSDVSMPRIKNHLLLKLPSREEGDDLGSQESTTSSDDLLQDLRLLHSIPPRPLVTEVVSKNFKLYSYLYRPFDWKQGQVFPTIVYVYGGPGFQLVRNSWTRSSRVFSIGLPLEASYRFRHIFLTMYLNLGYAVVMTDGRGSLNRGGEFETAISGRLGCVEVEDQVNALLTIKSVHGTIDLSRVALMGWSYGGYLALMGLAQYPNAFKVAIAGAPVTDWRFYDTAYTERYMGLPENNQEAYGQSSVANMVNKFPSVAGRLLILHGMRDENVHFKHTTTLIQALIEAGKPYCLQTYPDERHAFRNAAATSHMFATILSFLDANL
ncbi:hypothetical protein M514_10781 [Trichuris suis]|uniref:Dipeptidyl peptidase 8 n=1 Tax=Trichuris suis TaxID=68888 RepID=A0A085LTS3_9BILA|nr:hypothetical protein M513_10781 [Trichuris suis]KFD62283.1 hypothetical protein M514_10781 [Trichuris suis]